MPNEKKKSLLQIEKELAALSRTYGNEIFKEDKDTFLNVIEKEADGGVLINLEQGKYLFSDKIIVNADGSVSIPTLSGFLTTETDPIFSAWDKSTGISITESQISDFGSYLTTETDPISLHLDQSSAQDVTGGKPDFQEGIQIDGFDITYPTAFTPSGCGNSKTNLYFSDGATGGIYAMRVPSGKQNGSIGFYIEANATRREDPKILLKDMSGKYAGLGHNGSTYFFSDYDMFSIINNSGTDTLDFACKNIYSMYHRENPAILLRSSTLVDSSGNSTLNWDSGVVTFPTGITIHTPTNQPTYPVAGTIYFDVGDSHFYGFDGNNWKQLDN